MMRKGTDHPNSNVVSRDRCYLSNKVLPGARFDYRTQLRHIDRVIQKSGIVVEHVYLYKRTLQPVLTQTPLQDSIRASKAHSTNSHEMKNTEC